MHPFFNTTGIPLQKIHVISSPEGGVYEWHNCYFISYSKDFIEQMKSVLRIAEAKRNYPIYRYRPAGSPKEFARMGYIVNRLTPFKAKDF